MLMPVHFANRLIIHHHRRADYGITSLSGVDYLAYATYYLAYANHIIAI